MDKRKKKKTNKKKGIRREISIGNLRKTEMNCAQCQRQLFGLWKNESYQSCLDCSSKKKKSTVLTMLKSMKRVCEVRLKNPVDDNVVVRGKPRVEESAFSRGAKNKDIFQDLEEDSNVRRTRRSFNATSGHSFQSEGEHNVCKNKFVSDEPLRNRSSSKLNKTSEVHTTDDFNSRQEKKVRNTCVTQRRSSYRISKSPGIRSIVSSESIQKDKRNKIHRIPGRVHAELSIGNNVCDKPTTVSHANRSKRRQQVFVQEKSACKLAKEEEKVTEDRSQNINMYSDDTKRRQPSEIVEDFDIHGGTKNKIDNKNKSFAHRDERKRKQRPSRSSVEVKRSKVNTENSDFVHIKRPSKRSLSNNQNKSLGNQDDTKNLTNFCNNGSAVVDSKTRTRSLVSIRNNKTTCGTDSEKAISVDKLSDISHALNKQENPEDKEGKEESIYNKREDRKLPKTKLSNKMCGERDAQRQFKNPLHTDQVKDIPRIPARTLELLRSTRGMKPVVLVEKVMTLKQKVLQPPRNETRRLVTKDKGKTNSGQKYSKDDDSSNNANGNVQLSLRSNKQVSNKNKTDTKLRFNNKEGSIKLRRMLRRKGNKQNSSHKSGRSIGRGERKTNCMAVVQNKQNKKINIVERKEQENVDVKAAAGRSPLSVVAPDKKTRVIREKYACDKCKKDFVNELEQKSHELLHRGYFELKLKRIDTDFVSTQKVEGEIISRDIVNCMLKSVFSQETGDSGGCVSEVCERTNTQQNTILHSKGPHLRCIQLVLKPIDIGEAVAMNKKNEAIVVARSIINDILKSLDVTGQKDVVSERSVLVNDDEVDKDICKQNRTVELNSGVPDLEENLSNECKCSEDGGVENSGSGKGDVMDYDSFTFSECEKMEIEPQMCTDVVEDNKLDKIVSNLSSCVQDERNETLEISCNKYKENDIESGNCVSSTVSTESKVNVSQALHAEKSDASETDKTINQSRGNTENDKSEDSVETNTEENLEARCHGVGNKVDECSKFTDNRGYLKSINVSEMSPGGTCRPLTDISSEIHSSTDVDSHLRIEDNEADIADSIGSGNQQTQETSCDSEYDQNLLSSTECVDEGDDCNRCSVVSKTVPDSHNVVSSEECNNYQDINIQIGNDYDLNLSRKNEENKKRKSETDITNSMLDKHSVNDVSDSDKCVKYTNVAQNKEKHGDAVENSLKETNLNKSETQRFTSGEGNSCEGISMEVGEFKNETIEPIGSETVVTDCRKSSSTDILCDFSALNNADKGDKIRSKDKESTVITLGAQDESCGNTSVIEPNSDRKCDEVTAERREFTATTALESENKINEAANNSIINNDNPFEDNRKEDGSLIIHSEANSGIIKQSCKVTDVVNNDSCTFGDDNKDENTLSHHETKTCDDEEGESSGDHCSSGDTGSVSEKSESPGIKLFEHMHKTGDTENSKTATADSGIICARGQETERMLNEFDLQGCADNDILDMQVSQNADAMIMCDSLKPKIFSSLYNRNETNMSKYGEGTCTDFGNSVLESVSNTTDASCESTNVEEGAADDSMAETGLEKDSAKSIQTENDRESNLHIDDGTREVTTSNPHADTVENQTTGELNYKNVEKYFESFFKDLMVNEMESNETSIENDANSKCKKPDMNTEAENSEDLYANNAIYSDEVTEKGSFDDPHVSSITSIFLDSSCSSSNNEQIFEKANEKDDSASCSPLGTSVGIKPEDLNSERETDDCNVSAETEGGMQRSESKTEPRVEEFCNATTATSSGQSTSVRYKVHVQEQSGNKNETSTISAISYNTGNIQRKPDERRERVIPCESNRVTDSVQKQSNNKKETDLSSTSIRTDTARRFSGDRRATDSPPVGSDSSRRYSSDRREADYPMAASSNSHQRSHDSRRHYLDSHENRSYVDSRGSRGNTYGSNWRHQMSNRSHPYQNNQHKRNDRGGYSNWNWPSYGSYSYSRHGGSWR